MFIILEIEGGGARWISTLRVGQLVLVGADDASITLRSVHTDELKAKAEAKRLQAKLDSLAKR
ncbi:MAG: hypothetical protein AAB214_04320 [Fibrobacterota bacterium]